MLEPRLQTNLLEPSQALKEQLINELVLKLSVLNCGQITEEGLDVPPSNVVVGDAFLVGSSPTGLWAGKANQIAYFLEPNNWLFAVAPDGHEVSVKNKGKYRYDLANNNWVEVPVVSSVITSNSDSISFTGEGKDISPLAGEVKLDLASSSFLEITSNGLSLNTSLLLDRDNHTGKQPLNTIEPSGAFTGDTIVYNGTDWVPSAKVSNFLDLEDVPRTYTANKILAVNAAGDSLIFIDAPANNSSIQKVEIATNGSLIGSRKRLNFQPGSNTVINAIDNAAQDRIDIVINNTAQGEFNTASNLGGGTGLFATKVNSDLQFKSLIAGNNVTLSTTASTITINANTVGEINTASNAGSVGEGIFKQKTGENLEFKRLIQGNGIELVSSTNGITINNIAEQGSNLIVRDEGTILTTGVQSLNFVGAGVSLTEPVANEIEISVLELSASNIGSGNGVYAGRSGQVLQFKSLVQGAGVSITNNANAITISSVNNFLIKDEGTTLTTSPTELNFTGPGITATNSGGAVTINVPSYNTSDNTVNYTTSVLASQGHETLSLPMGRANVILNVTSNKPCRLRFYLNTSYRSADLNRAVGTDPIGEHGVLLDVATSVSNLSIDCAPLPVIAALGTGNNLVPMAITNLDATSGSITVTISYLSL